MMLTFLTLYMFAGRARFHSCKGWTDEYGNWNTGFQCPMWGGPEDEYCCGTATNRYCCIEPLPVAPTEEVDS